jgi:hypothetical protein
VPAETNDPALAELTARLEREEQAYAEVLAAVDALSTFALPAEQAPVVRERLERLNALWAAPARPTGGGLGGVLQRRAWDALAPFVERQTEFNAALVQLLNARLDETDRLHARLRELAGALVRYAQRVQPLLDARARLASGLATTRSELVLEAFSRQLESHARRLDGLAAVGERLDRVAAELERLRPPADPAAPGTAGSGD